MEKATRQLVCDSSHSMAEDMTNIASEWLSLVEIHGAEIVTLDLGREGVAVNLRFKTDQCNQLFCKQVIYSVLNKQTNKQNRN
jgi:hypothetical protein